MVDVAKAVLGIWLFVSTAALTPHSISNELSPALLNNMVTGGVLLASSILAAATTSSTSELVRTRRRRHWAYFTFAISLWLVVSPWILGYGDVTRLAVNGVLSGVVLAGLALINLGLVGRLGHDEQSGFVPQDS